MTASHGDTRVPPAELCVIRPLLERRAADSPDITYVVAPDGASWTYAAFRESVVRAASGLRELGVKQGDHVLSWLPNGPDAIRVWFGAQLARRRLRADQPRLPRRHARARRRELRTPG